MGNRDIKERIKDFLYDRYDAKVQGNKEWFMIQCPFCGDSPNPNTRHLNVRISVNDDHMYVKCFQSKCDVAGPLTSQHLMKMGLSDMQVLKFVSDKSKITSKMVRNISSTKLNLQIPEKKRIPSEYFKARTKKEMTDDNIRKYRIVTDFTKFYELNKDTIDYDKKLGLLMYKESENKNFIGFLNESGTYLQVRSVDDDDTKHIKIPLVKLPIYVSHQPYVLTRNFDLAKRDVYIYVTEGLFDIVNVYNYFMDDGLYMQTGSASSIYGQFKKFSKFYYGVYWVFVRDRDVSIKFFKNLKEQYDYRFKNDAYVVYNELSKDFGDFREPIQVRKIKI